MTRTLHDSPPRRRTNRRAWPILWCIRIIIVGAFIAAWELAITWHIANPVFVGTPAGTARAFIKQFGSRIVTKDLETTLYETLVGFAISVVAGFLFGVLLSRAPLLHRAVLPILTAANSLPRIALAPLFILWFGLGPFAKIALVVSFVFFVMLATTIAGFTQPNSDFELLAGSIGASSWQEVTLFLLPGAMPSLIAGLELSLVYSFLGAVSGEIVGGESGLGVQLTSLSNGFEINKFLAVLLLLVIVTTFTVVIMRLITAPLTRWHKAESRRGDQL